MEHYLFTPGPVPVSIETALSEAMPMISHRGADHHELFSRIQEKLSALLRSSGPCVIFPSSGTGALEAICANFCTDGARVLSFSCGTFGGRWREIARAVGANVTCVDVPMGRGITPELAASEMKKGRFDAVLLTMNETSTGVLNPVREIISALPEDGPLVFVDGVSAVGAAPCFPEEWRIDGLATASQKGLQTPPGLGIVRLSERAWAALERRRIGSYYFDLLLQRKYLADGAPENPYTPPVSLYRALDASLQRILAEPRWFELRAWAARSLAAGLEALGFELFVREPSFRSPGVTAFSHPTISASEISAKLKAIGVELSGGMGEMKGRLLRVAHYHDVRWPEISLLLGSLFAAVGGDAARAMRAALDEWEG